MRKGRKEGREGEREERKPCDRMALIKVRHKPLFEELWRWSELCWSCPLLCESEQGEME